MQVNIAKTFGESLRRKKKKKKKKDQNISGIGLDHECLSASKVFHETCIG